MVRLFKLHMRDPNSTGVHNGDSDNEESSLDGHAMTDVKSAYNSPGTPIMSEVARKVGALTDPQPKQLELLRHQLKDLRQGALRRCEETSSLTQDLSRAPTLGLTWLQHQ